jgi:hypothetical protein
MRGGPIDAGWRAGLVAAILVLGACGGGATGPTAPAEPADSSLDEWEPVWGADLVLLFEDLATVCDEQRAIGVAGWFTPGGSLDLRAVGGPLATAEAETADAVRDLWFMCDPAGPRVDVDVEEVFARDDGAVVTWVSSIDGVADRWAQLFVAAGTGRLASRLYAPPAPDGPGVAPVAAEAVVDRWLSAWADGTPEALAAVYATDATLRDPFGGGERRGVEAIAGADGPPVTRHGRVPVHGFTVPGTDLHEAIVVVDTDGACPMVEARRWILDGDGRILDESRYLEVVSARRCLGDPGDGWWMGWAPPEPSARVLVDEIEVAGRVVELVNAELSHPLFARWLLERFTEAGLAVPEVRAMWFPPAPECVDRGGLALDRDERYAGQPVVFVCFEASEVHQRRPKAGWRPVAAIYGLHELAHIWMTQHLDDTTRDGFVDRLDLPTWSAASSSWSERGVEHAASTIAWGLAGDRLARYMIPPAPPCEELTDRYVALTGRPPLTTCDADPEP